MNKSFKSNKGRRSQNNVRRASSLKQHPTTLNWNVSGSNEPGFRNVIARDNKTHTVTQTSTQGTIIQSSNTVPIFYSKYFSSADILQFSTFAAVFDQYKIDFVEVWIRPFGAALSASYAGSPKIFTVVDYDDANTVTALSALQEYQNCVTTNVNEGHYIKFKPHIAQALYGGAFTQFGNIPAGWIDCGSTGVQHYGLKVGVSQTVPASTDLALDMYTRITVSFRNVF